MHCQEPGVYRVKSLSTTTTKENVTPERQRAHTEKGRVARQQEEKKLKKKEIIITEAKCTPAVASSLHSSPMCTNVTQSWSTKSTSKEKRQSRQEKKQGETKCRKHGKGRRKRGIRARTTKLKKKRRDTKGYTNSSSAASEEAKGLNRKKGERQRSEGKSWVCRNMWMRCPLITGLKSWKEQEKGGETGRDQLCSAKNTQVRCVQHCR